jgi:hypothetical protein
MFLSTWATIMMVLLVYIPVLAQTTIDPNNEGAHYAWGENVGWLNFKPNSATGPGTSRLYLGRERWLDQLVVPEH